MIRVDDNNLLHLKNNLYRAYNIIAHDNQSLYRRMHAYTVHITTEICSRLSSALFHVLIGESRIVKKKWSDGNLVYL